LLIILTQYYGYLIFISCITAILLNWKKIQLIFKKTPVIYFYYIIVTYIKNRRNETKILCHIVYIWHVYNNKLKYINAIFFLDSIQKSNKSCKTASIDEIVERIKYNLAQAPFNKKNVSQN